MNAYRISAATTTGGRLATEYAPTKAAAVHQAADRWMDEGARVIEIHPAEYLGTVEQYEATFLDSQRGWAAKL